MNKLDPFQMSLDELLVFACEYGNLLPELKIQDRGLEVLLNGEAVLLDAYQSKLFLRAIVNEVQDRWMGRPVTVYS